MVWTKKVICFTRFNLCNVSLLVFVFFIIVDKNKTRGNVTTTDHIFFFRKHDKFGVCCADYLVKVYFCEFFYFIFFYLFQSMVWCVDYIEIEWMRILYANFIIILCTTNKTSCLFLYFHLTSSSQIFVVVELRK